MIIHSYDNSKRAESCIEYLKGAACVDSVDRVILLPIPTTRDNSAVLNTNIYINDVLKEVKCGDVVSCYGLPTNYLEAARERGARVIDLAFDEDFLYENAELTALCTLGILLNTTDRSPRDLSVGVVGYGRIGKRLTNVLLYLGARVRVYTSREATRIDLCEYGVASAASTERADLSGLDILINTAPAVIFGRDAVPPDLRVIDLASGDNFPGRDVERYPSVPAKMLPFSAGRAWGRAIERFIVNNP